MNHDEYISTATRCWTRTGAMGVVRDVQQAILKDQPRLPTEDVRAALACSEELMDDVRRWKSPPGVDDEVQRLLRALDKIVAPKPGVARARDTLRAMLLVSSRRTVMHFRGESPQDCPQFVMIVDNAACR